jgi:hypothetical protein
MPRPRPSGWARGRESDLGSVSPGIKRASNLIASPGRAGPSLGARRPTRPLPTRAVSDSESDSESADSALIQRSGRRCQRPGPAGHQVLSSLWAGIRRPGPRNPRASVPAPGPICQWPGKWPSGIFPIPIWRDFGIYPIWPPGIGRIRRDPDARASRISGPVNFNEGGDCDEPSDSGPHG